MKHLLFLALNNGKLILQPWYYAIYASFAGYHAVSIDRGYAVPQKRTKTFIFQSSIFEVQNEDTFQAGCFLGGADITGVITLPIWGESKIQIHGTFQGFPLL